MRLGVVTRSLIVLSVFWMVGATGYFAVSTSNAAHAAATEVFDNCINSGVEFGQCWESREIVRRARTDQLAGGLWGFSAARAALPLVITLMLLAVCYGAVRWILAGRRAGE